MGQYFPERAQQLTRQRRQEAAQRRRTGDAALMAHVEAKLKVKWSPEEIAGRLRTKPPKKLRGKTISHATIYRWIWGDPQRAERLRTYLRVAYKKRRKVYGKPSKRGQIPNRVSIEERPAIVEERQRLGDWEGDTIVGKGRSGYVLTNVDRASRYIVARKLDRATGQAVSDAMYQAMRRMPPEKRKCQGAGKLYHLWAGQTVPLERRDWPFGRLRDSHTGNHKGARQWPTNSRWQP